MTEGKPKLEKPKINRDQPWAVRGISIEAREAAIFAAKQSNQTLGKWLDRAIIDQSHIQLLSRKDVGQTEQQMVAQMLKSMQETLEKTNQRLDSIEKAKSGFFSWFKRAG